MQRSQRERCISPSLCEVRSLLNASSPALTAPQTVVTRVIGIFLSLLVLFHALMLVSYNLPYNPLTSPYQKQIDGYMLPWMFQQWSFFAPTPEGWWDEAYFRYEISDGQNSKTTDWIDMQSVFPASYAIKPLSVLSVDRDVAYSLLISVNNDSDGLRAVSKFVRGPKSLRELSDAQRSLALLFESLAPTLCVLPQNGRARVAAVQMSVTRRPFTHFSERFHFGKPRKDGTFSESTTVRFPWLRATGIAPIRGLSLCLV